MGLACVFVAVAPAEFAGEFEAEDGEPGVIPARLPGPDSTRMPDVTGAVMRAILTDRGWDNRGRHCQLPLSPRQADSAATVAKFRVGENPVGRVEKLDCLEQHFDYVFITVPAGSLALPPVEGEDVHLD